MPKKKIEINSEDEGMEDIPEAPYDEETSASESEGGDIAALQAEIAELKDQLLRSVAETENVRKRAASELEDIGKYAITGFARDLLNVLDDLHRAEESIPQDQVEDNELLKNINEGFKLLKSDFTKTLEKHGIQRISPLGEPFDHNFHQAVVQVESDEYEAGMVAQVMQAGYVIHGRLLRPAMVAVVKG